jgi:demethylsterigmatocystin 6-O-methyltransferase
MSATSVLLIDDKAIPDERVPGAPSILSATEYSLTMFAMFKAVERRESQWLKLLDNAGYKVSAFKHYSEKYDCIIIAEKKE